MTSQVDTSCFQASYQAARQHLLAAVSAVPAELIRQHRAYTHPETGPDAQPLHLDWFFLGKTEFPHRILVLISGTHGVEGFTGSAIQSHSLHFLCKLVDQNHHLGIIIIHALNPWGFAWLRRYDHQGIDLNRNFVDFNAPLPDNPDYEQIHNDLICTTLKPLANTLGYWQSQWGKERFTTVITRGQYRHSNGLFYGGAAASWSRQILEQACNNAALHNAERISVIDLHTGLGPFGYGEVINDHQPGTTGFDWACQWYGSEARSALLGESCSPPKDGLLDYFWHALLGERGCFITLEYGTFALDELLRVSCVEQRYHNSYGQMIQKRDLSDPSVVELREFFYPQDNSWRRQVLIRAEQIISLAVQGILK